MTHYYLYIHIPWCLQKCIYCDFNSNTLCSDEDVDQYISALCADIKQELSHSKNSNKDNKIQSIFFGGGTPTILPPEKIQHIINTISSHASIVPDAEISIEANPETVDKEKLVAIKQAGVNRISFGVQTFDDIQLQYLQRAHTASKAVEIIKIAQYIGLTNINIDLMFGLPGQTTEQMHDDIKQAFALNPTHISHYQLTLEPDTRLTDMAPHMPSEELLSKMYEQSRNQLGKYGYHNYETSAFAKPGFECQHNLNYWHFGDFIGVGAGAHGKQTLNDKIIRYHKPKDYRDYISAIELDNVRQAEVLSQQEIILEFMINAMRLNDGWTTQLFEDNTGIKFSTIQVKINKLVKLGLIRASNDTILPTPKGRMLQDTILAEFV